MSKTIGISEEARRARNAYLREWRRKNPDKAKAIKDRYWEKKAREAASQEVTQA